MITQVTALVTEYMITWLITWVIACMLAWAITWVIACVYVLFACASSVIACVSLRDYVTFLVYVRKEKNKYKEKNIKV